jgi:hypothetical protein
MSQECLHGPSCIRPHLSFDWLDNFEETPHGFPVNFKQFWDQGQSTIAMDKQFFVHIM